MIINSYKDLRIALNKIGCNYPNCGEWLFRGLPSDKFKLIPSLYYSPQPLFPRWFEKNILAKFIKRGMSKSHLKANKKRKIWINAFLARHYGLRSRMIDWTIDLSVALYFMRGKNNVAGNTVLYIMPSDFIRMENSDIVYSKSYFEFNSTLVLNPSFNIEDMEIIGSRNRFIQNGKFLIQDYRSAKEDFYKKNKKHITKIEIPVKNLDNIYIDCCKEFGNDPSIDLMLDDPTNYDFCANLNKGKKWFSYIF